MKKKMIIKEQKGAAVIEFVIVLIVLVLLAVGATEFGLLLYNKQVITNASREGARAGIVNGEGSLDEGAVRAVVKDYCNQRLIDFDDTSLDDGDIDLNPSPRTTVFGDDFSVTVTYNYHFLIPLLFKMETTIPIRAKTMMKMEDLTGSGS